MNLMVVSVKTQKVNPASAKPIAPSSEMFADGFCISSQVTGWVWGVEDAATIP
jgi:hypothetical protein